MQLIRQIELLYPADYDFEPKGEASWADVTLVKIIQAQQERIERLERKLEAHIKRQAAYEFEGI